MNQKTIHRIQTYFDFPTDEGSSPLPLSSLQLNKLRRFTFGMVVSAVFIAGANTGTARAQFENKAEGIAKNEVVIGTSIALSGTLAYMGKAIEEGMTVYFKDRKSVV